jgi:hypothetical protein
MPIYQDLDYNYLVNMKKNVQYQFSQKFKTIKGEKIIQSKNSKVTIDQMKDAMKLYKSLL